MSEAIQQTVRFAATARELYDLYLDPKRHSAFTGGPVKISARPGSRFDAFGGMLTGRMLLTVPSRLIVHQWRSVNFKKSDPDSILILVFTQEGKQGRIDLTHVNVAPQDHAGVQKGWRKYYWAPLRAYLKGRARPGATMR